MNSRSNFLVGQFLSFKEKLGLPLLGLVDRDAADGTNHSLVLVLVELLVVGVAVVVEDVRLVAAKMLNFVARFKIEGANRTESESLVRKAETFNDRLLHSGGKANGLALASGSRHEYGSRATKALLSLNRMLSHLHDISIELADILAVANIFKI